MCGRIVDDLTAEQIADYYRVVGATRLGVEHRPNYNVRPTNTIRAVRLDADGKRELAALLRWAEREAVLHEYGRILAGKALTGKAVTKARKLMAERGLATEQEATAIARAEQVEAARKYGRRRLALAYAVERTQSTARGKRMILSAQTVVAIVRKFGDACALYVTGKRGAPKFKVRGDTASLQRQVSAGAAAPVDFAASRVDLAGVLGSEDCRAVPAILHRPLPAGATVKQVAVTSTAKRAHVVFMVEAPVASFVRAVPEVPASAVAGIDPGRKTACYTTRVEHVPRARV